MGVGCAIYPGSFDPITLGHLDIIHRARELFDTVIVAVAYNETKKPLFTADERVALIEKAIDGVSGIVVERFDGLLIDFARRKNAFAVLRGLRAISDFEFEFQMALMNRRLEPKLETIFMTPTEEFTYLSSRLVKEVARLGGDVEPFVPPVVVSSLRAKFSPIS